jgi:uncharacterized delta-60 repeat protein
MYSILPLIVCLLLLLPFNGFAQKGVLDPGFGIGGRVKTSFQTRDFGVAVRLTTDNKIIVLGQQYSATKSLAALAKYLPDGRLDATFGTLGISNPDPNFNLLPTNLLLQNDGKILITATAWNAATNTTDFILMRCLANGSIDLSFGQNGSVITDFANTDDTPWDLAIQPDGKILVTGESAGSSGGARENALALIRYLPDGQLDNSFGQSGKLRFGISPGDEASVCINLKPDGKIILGGYAVGNSGGEDMLIMQLNPDGQRDLSFGSSGFVLINNSVNDRVKAIKTDNQGRIVVFGKSIHNNDLAAITMEFIRLLPNGAVDLSFGGGLNSFSIPGKSIDVLDMALDQQGGVIMLGGHSANVHLQHFLVRVDSNAILDASFGMNGRTNTEDTIVGNKLVIQPDDKIVVTGTSFVSANAEQVAVVRYHNKVAVSVANTANEQAAIIYPNPASDRLFLKGRIIKEERFTLTDMAGRTVLTDHTNEIVSSGLDISGLAPGFYLAQYRTPTGKQTQLIQVSR